MRLGFIDRPDGTFDYHAHKLMADLIGVVNEDVWTGRYSAHTTGAAKKGNFGGVEPKFQEPAIVDCTQPGPQKRSRGIILCGR